MNLKHALFLSLMLGVAGAARAADPIVIKFSHVVAPDTPKGRAAEEFKRLAEQMTRGRVKVEVYPNSQLYTDREEMEAMGLGAVQMLAPSLSKFGPLGAREFEVFDLPYLFPSYEVVHRVMDGPVGRKLFSRLEPKGIIGLAYWDNGFKQMSANRALRGVSDFKGLRMRVQSSKVLEAQMKALGAVPLMTAFDEVYAALQQGVVDGAENPVSNFYTQRMHAVQKHLTISDHGYLGYGVIVNKRFWDGLPAEVRGQLGKAMAETTAYERRIARKDNDDALAAVKRAGTTQVYVLPDPGREDWRRVLLPLHKEFEPQIGRDVIQSIYNVAAQVEQERVSGSAPPRR